MTGEELFAALDGVDDRFLAEADARRIPVQKPQFVEKAEKQEKSRTAPVFGGTQPVSRRNIFATAVCTVLLVGALCLVPLIMRSGRQISAASSTVEPGGETLAAESHFHVIFRGFDELDELLLLEKQGDALTAYLKESGLWSQGVQTEDDVQAIREIICAIPIPTLNGQEPKTMEIVEGKYGFAAEFDDIYLFVNGSTYINAWPEGSVQVSEDPVLFLEDTQEMADGSYVFYLAGICDNYFYSAAVSGTDLDSALERMGQLEFRFSSEQTGEPMIPLIDTWTGTYQDGSWELKHVVDAYSDVELSVRELTVSHDADTHFGSEGYITLELLSEKDQTVELRLVASQSDDNLATILNETIPMKAGEKTTYAPLRFEGWSAFSYELCIEAGNTRIIFTIYPPVEE